MQHACGQVAWVTSRGRQRQWHRALGAADGPRWKLCNWRKFQTPVWRPWLGLCPVRTVSLNTRQCRLWKRHWERVAGAGGGVQGWADRCPRERAPGDKVAGFLLLLRRSLSGWRREGEGLTVESWGQSLEGAVGLYIIRPPMFSPGSRRFAALTQQLPVLLVGLLLCSLSRLLGRLSTREPLML